MRPPLAAAGACGRDWLRAPQAAAPVTSVPRPEPTLRAARWVWACVWVCGCGCA